MSGESVEQHQIDMIMAAFACDRATAEVIGQRSRTHKFSSGETVIRLGDASHAWIMFLGEARAVAYAPGGQFVLVHAFGPGDFFGEAAGIPVSNAEVVAAMASESGRVASADFVALMESHRAIADGVARGLVRRLGETTQRMIEMSTLSAGGRIHAELLRRARLGDGMAIRPAPVLTDFALSVHATRETVSRAISLLEKRGIIRREDGAMIIVAPHRLEELIY